MRQGHAQTAPGLRENGRIKTILIETGVARVGPARLPTRFGDFQIYVFEDSRDHKEHVALVRGQLRGATDVPLRLHSECLTGDVLGSLRCDCGAQLEQALDVLGQQPQGILLYMRQEGRGIGLGNKLRAYVLQDHGLDTVEANEHLGFDADLRHYDIAAEILRQLEVASVNVYTNNLHKIEELKQYGVQVLRRSPLVTIPQQHNSSYLQTKREKCGHIL